MTLHDISIVGGGWSVSQIDLAKIPRPVIGVNESGLLTPNVNYIVTMDRLWTENRWVQLLTMQHIQFWVRRSAVKNIDTNLHSNCHTFECDHRMCIPDMHDPNRLNGSNSGACAINLAMKLKPKCIWLFGFDLSRGPQNEPYWHAPYEWRPEGATKIGKYYQWANDMKAIASVAKVHDIKILTITNSVMTPYFLRLSIPEFRMATRASITKRFNT